MIFYIIYGSYSVIPSFIQHAFTNSLTMCQAVHWILKIQWQMILALGEFRI